MVLCSFLFKLTAFRARQLPQGRASENLALRPSICQSRLHSFRDQRSLKLGNGSDHLKHQFTCWQRGIDRFRHGYKVDPMALHISSPDMSCFNEGANLSNFQTTTTSTDRRRQAFNSSFRAGRFELAPETPWSR
jgi:hypothetical protein